MPIVYANGICIMIYLLCSMLAAVPIARTLSTTGGKPAGYYASGYCSWSAESLTLIMLAVMVASAKTKNAGKWHNHIIRRFDINPKIVFMISGIAVIILRW